MLTLAFGPSGGAPPATTGRGVGVWRDDQGRVLARRHASSDRRWIDWPTLGVFAFSPGSQSVDVWPAPGVERETVERTFARVLQPIVLQALGWQALHASAVLGPDGVFVFCGRSGSGKSTLAYAFGIAGHAQFADDALVFELVNDQAVGHAVPFVPRLTDSAHTFFRIGESAEPDHLRLSVRTGTAAPIAAIFLPRREPGFVGPAVIRPVAPTRAFAALLSHAHCFDEADSRETQRLVADYLTVVEQVPVYELLYCSGFEHLVQVVDAINHLAGGASLRPRAVSSSLVVHR